MIPLPSRSILFPYTTLFRSWSRPMSRTEVRVCQSMVPRGRVGGIVPRHAGHDSPDFPRSEEHTSELQSSENLVCRLLPAKTKYETEDKYTLITKRFYI